MWTDLKLKGGFAFINHAYLGSTNSTSHLNSIMRWLKVPVMSYSLVTKELILDHCWMIDIIQMDFYSKSNDVCTFL